MIPTIITLSRCVDCFDYFKDALGKTQITDLDSVILPIDKNNHTEVIDAGKPATCTEAGLSEGKHCSECGTVIKAQTVTEKLGHKYTNKVTTATLTKDASDRHEDRDTRRPHADGRHQEDHRQVE